MRCPRAQAGRLHTTCVLHGMREIRSVRLLLILSENFNTNGPTLPWTYFLDVNLSHQWFHIFFFLYQHFLREVRTDRSTRRPRPFACRSSPERILRVFLPLILGLSKT